MKVLVVTQYFWPENFRINDLVHDLVKRGHKVTVLTGYPNYPDGRIFSEFKVNAEEYRKYFGAEIVRVPHFSRGKTKITLILNYLSFAISSSTLGLFALRNNSYDVTFVCQLSPVTVGIPAVMFKYLTKTPVVIWVLDLWPETLNAMGIKSQVIIIPVKQLVSFIYNRCDLILGQSRGFIKSIRKHCQKPDKFRYFPSWAETVFSNKSEYFAPEIEINLNNFNILFAGNIGKSQDFPSILNAVQLLREYKNIKWIIVGDGRDAAWVKKELKTRGLEDAVQMVGRYPLSRMPSFIAHADALLVSLKKDPVFSLTIPGKVQAYLMSGVPILGMLDGEGAKVIMESKSGFVSAAGDSEGLAESVLAMKKLSAEQREELGRNGKLYAEREFDREKLLDQLEVWLSSITCIK